MMRWGNPSRHGPTKNNHGSQAFSLHVSHDCYIKNEKNIPHEGEFRFFFTTEEETKSWLLQGESNNPTKGEDESYNADDKPHDKHVTRGNEAGGTGNGIGRRGNRKGHGK